MIEGFINFKNAEGLSPNTLSAYIYILNRLLKDRGDIEISTVTAQELTNYLAWLRTDYQPHRFNHQVHPISEKTLRNVYITFRSFFGCINQQFNLPNPILGVAAPRFQKAPGRV
jgi:integrase/recombinase XerD